MYRGGRLQDFNMTILYLVHPSAFGLIPTDAKPIDGFAEASQVTDLCFLTTIKYHQRHHDVILQHCVPRFDINGIKDAVNIHLVNGIDTTEHFRHDMFFAVGENPSHNIRFLGKKLRYYHHPKIQGLKVSGLIPELDALINASEYRVSNADRLAKVEAALGLKLFTNLTITDWSAANGVGFGVMFARNIYPRVTNAVSLHRSRFEQHAPLSLQVFDSINPHFIQQDLSDYPPHMYSLVIKAAILLRVAVFGFGGVMKNLG